MKKLISVLLCFLVIFSCNTQSSEKEIIQEEVSLGQDAHTFYNKANDYFKSKQYQLAADYYTKALAITPEEHGYYQRGNCYGYLSRYQDAIDDYTTLISINPYFYKAYQNRGFTYGMLENYKKAIDDFTEAIKINPEFARAYKMRGMAREKLGLPYCSDYKKCCDLNDSDCCNFYSKQCK